MQGSSSSNKRRKIDIASLFDSSSSEAEDEEGSRGNVTTLTKNKGKEKVSRVVEPEAEDEIEEELQQFDEMLDTEEKIRQVSASIKFSKSSFTTTHLVINASPVSLGGLKNSSNTSYIVVGTLNPAIKLETDEMKLMGKCLSESVPCTMNSSSRSRLPMDAVFFGGEHYFEGHGELSSRRRTKCIPMIPPVKKLFDVVKKCYPLINSVAMMGMKTHGKYMPSTRFMEPEMIPEYPIVFISFGSRRRMMMIPQENEENNNNILPLPQTENFIQETTLDHKTVVIIGGKIHKTHTTSIPKEKSSTSAAHISLVFRAFNLIGRKWLPRPNFNDDAKTNKKKKNKISSSTTSRKRGSQSMFNDDEAEEISGDEDDIEFMELDEDEESEEAEEEKSD